jgi:hypothetical protein
MRSTWGKIIRRVAAFLLAPVPASLLGEIVASASGGFPPPDSVFFYYLLLLYAAQMLFGLPIRAFLLRAGRISAVGAALGGAAMIAWVVATHPNQLAEAPAVLALWLLMGAVTGLTAWLLTRPEKTTTAPH